MTRDEAIEYLIERASELEQHRKHMLIDRHWQVERAELAEAKAALAVPMMIDHAIPGDDKTVMVSLNRCQHQAADASLDCTEPAVLCEAHGGHDACAVEIMRLEGALVDALRGGFAAKAQAEQRTRDEIARALREWSRYGRKHLRPTDGFDALDAAAEQILSGSIREWLPKEEG